MQDHIEANWLWKSFEHKMYIYGAVFLNAEFEYTTAQTYPRVR